MDPTRHLELLRAEGDRLAAMPADALAAPVPALPDWTVERVVRHTGKVHQWVAAALTAGPEADLGSLSEGLAGLPKGPACLPAYREALDSVVAALAGRDADDPAVTFTGPGSVRFWARRQAHEVAVHRIDAADAVHAAGGPPPATLTVDGAVDAIDEWATMFLAVRWGQRFGAFPDELEGRTVHVHGTDPIEPGVAPTPVAEWLLSFSGGSVAVTSAHAKGNVALRGSAEDLLLALWRRRPLDVVEVHGDRELAARLLDLARF